MCGIVAAASERNIVPLLIDGLQALEYRGYDSAGFAVLADQQLHRVRAAGKVQALRIAQQSAAIESVCGIAHTRWATHGVPSVENAHPLASYETTCVVHNGIIENHEALRLALRADGFAFTSQTDTEVIAHLLEQLQRNGLSLLAAVQAAVQQFHGAYSIAAISKREPGHVVGARRGSPLVVGLGQGENFIASDIHALIGETKQFIYLAEGDVVSIRADQIAIFDMTGSAVERLITHSQFSADAMSKGEYKHYMLKEIVEQPQAIADTLEGRIAGGKILTEIFGVDAKALLAKTQAVQIIACGTSSHAGQVARYWIEQLARIPCHTEIASEYRYRDPVVQPNTLLVTISQSGETMDTLAALRMAKTLGYAATLAICNVPESSLVRESDLVLMTRAGPEIGVASTKAFTTQLTALALLALELARAKGIEEARYLTLVDELTRLPGDVAEALKLDESVQVWAEQFIGKQHALFLGRGPMYPIAMEGALKLKEVSYIHAEAYPAGELKHGPLALVDSDMPVIAVAPNDSLHEKLKSNVEEVRARGGRLYLLADPTTAPGIHRDNDAILILPPVGLLSAPVVHTIPLQLLAYHVAVGRGTDVDQPRNLAKSVTVE